MSKFDFSKTVGGQILAESLKGWGKSLVFHGHTLGKIERLCDKRDRIHSEHQKAKAAKARNIVKLARQVELTSQYNQRGEFIDIEGELNYKTCECNDTQLNKNIIAFVEATCPNEDLTDE